VSTDAIVAGAAMNESSPSFVEQTLGQLLRHPEPLREREVERALQRLQAARGDAAYLLMHRVLVLEAALGQLRAAPADVGSSSTGAVAAVAAPRTPPQPARGFLRDAAVVAAGVVAGQAVWQGLTGDADGAGLAGSAGDALAQDDGGLGLDGWL
jgi:hypothetical protein